MLVLHRKRGESIVIEVSPEVRIHVVVVEIRAGFARLGIEAPAHITVNRLEVQNKVDRKRELRDDSTAY